MLSEYPRVMSYLPQSNREKLSAEGKKLSDKANRLDDTLF